MVALGFFAMIFLIVITGIVATHAATCIVVVPLSVVCTIFGCLLCGFVMAIAND